MNSHVIVVIPTYNERSNIVSLVHRVFELDSLIPGKLSIVVVDDDSPDGTGQAVSDLQQHYPNLYLSTGQKLGLGTAYCRGFHVALDELDGDIVVQMDADWSHDPAEIPALVTQVKDAATIALGSRYCEGAEITEGWGKHRILISKVGNSFARKLLGLGNVLDCTTGFRAIKAASLREIDFDTLNVRGYLFQVAVLFQLVRRGGTAIEHPIRFADRAGGASKLGWRDLLEFATKFWRFWFERLGLTDSRLIRLRRFYNHIGFQIGTLWLVFVWAVGYFGLYTGNEVDVLPFARQTYNPDWLPGDWYLNLDIGYRTMFGWPVGWLLETFGFDRGAEIGRTLVHGLLAAGFVVLYRSFGLGILGMIAAGLLFARNQDLAAYEFIIGGLDAKAFAYAFVVAALGFAMRGKTIAAACCSGLAVSFHMLIGVYAGFCLVVSLLLTREWFALRHKVTAVVVGMIAGIPGLVAIARHLVSQSDTTVAHSGWLTYINYRVPYRLLPETWHTPGWWVPLILVAMVCVIFVRVPKLAKFKTPAVYTLLAIALFCTGLVINAYGPREWLRFYWFRFGDVMVPLLGWALTLVAAKTIFFNKHQVAFAALCAALVISAVLMQPDTFVTMHSPKRVKPMLTWIKKNTERDATFLISSKLLSFYQDAERSPYVAYMHAPQSGVKVAEWFERLKLQHDVQHFDRRGYYAFAELDRLHQQLSAEHLAMLADTHGVDYYLARRATTLKQLLKLKRGKGLRDELPFCLVHKLWGYKLYDLRRESCS